MKNHFRRIVGLGIYAWAFGAGALSGCGSKADDDAAAGSSGAGRSATAGAAGRAQGGSAGTTAGDAGRSDASAGASATGGRSENAGGSGGKGGGSGGKGGGSGGNGGKGGGAGGGHGGTSATSMGGEAPDGYGGEDTTNGGAGVGGTCESVVVASAPAVPTVELLVDTSSSMFETMPTTWSVLYDALMDPSAGVVKPLEDRIRFGFLSYKGHLASSETDPACATMTVVAPALDNFDAIDSVYQSVGATYNPSSPPSPHWETPTNYAIGYASNLLLADSDAGPKYILLVTDGNPNTCVTEDPKCGQDQALKAAQAAYAAGVGLMVLGIGDIISQPNSGCSTSERCGKLHLQDLANAGIGAPVQPPPGCDDPSADTCLARYETCSNGTLTASYTSDAPDAGYPFEVDTTASDAATQLVAALTSLLSGTISCSIPIHGATSKTELQVTVGDTLRVEGDPDGWVLANDGQHITLQGGACIDFKALQPLTLDAPCR